MSIAEVAAAARAIWPLGTSATSAGELPTAVLMTAIAGAESGYDVAARGDSEAELQAAGSSAATVASVAGGGCGGYGSFGAWQVFLPVHLALVSSLAGGSLDPCQAASWLTASAYNAARAANEILYEDGPGAWSTYTGGQWLAHLAEAEAAVGQAATPGNRGAVWAAVAVAGAAAAAVLAAGGG